jgi:1,4-dihydroxy-2-naphthoate octaprenyltransferase
VRTPVPDTSPVAAQWKTSWESTLKHLRFRFSFFLMPVFIFALSQAASINWRSTVMAFVILHVLIFPSSNGYNSYQDRDESSIGGLKHPPKVSKSLYYVSQLFDSAGVLLGLLISPLLSLLILVLVLMSRAYSYRNVRLKKYPILGFLTVFVFQGAFVYLVASSAITNFSLGTFLSGHSLLCMSIASLFIGSMYPLTQIYQHQSDKKDGVITISYKLGYMGTFVFSSALFAAGSLLLFLLSASHHQPIAFVVFLAATLPVIVYLVRWTDKVRRDIVHASFENTMRMIFLASLCMNTYFGVMILDNHWRWF